MPPAEHAHPPTAAVRQTAPQAVLSSLPKYRQVVARVRGQIAEGSLRPGAPVPSGAALSRATGFSTLTCRKALRVLIADGVLVPGPSRNARPRVAAPGQSADERGLADAARALSAALAGRRHAAGLTQPELAARAFVSVTTVGHAETGRLWQSRQFWNRADQALRAGGELLRLHDAYRTAVAPKAEQAQPGERQCGQTLAEQSQGGQTLTDLASRGQAATAVRRDWAVPAAVLDAVSPVADPATDLPIGTAGATCVLIVWADGTITTVRPPASDGPTQ
jgi:DNA-binding transcriptional regulator YhcF (GntR family)